MDNSLIKILIVEDSAVQAEKLRRILAAEGYAVLVARDGTGGLAMAKEEEPDLVVTDVMMPEMNGFTLCRLIKDDSPTPVILLTSLSDPTDVISGLECGADNFIVKPYDEKLLLKRVRQLLVNREFHEVDSPQMGVEILFSGKKYFITSEKRQILDLLISTYENAVQKNSELIEAKEELQTLNEELEQRVTERTAELTAEIEQRKKTEDKLLQSQKMESIGTLAGGIAHDFNNILSVIIGYGQIVLMKMPSDDPSRFSIEQMLEASDRAAHLTKDLLLFSRKQVSDKKAIDLNGVVGKVGKFLTKLIGEDIDYKTVLHESPLQVLADEHQLEQVLMNLATNAGHSMPQGGSLKVTTSTVTLDESFIANYAYGKPGQFVLLTVEDTGIGMNEETRQRIFEPFFTTKEVGKGTGLGLAVVYGIVRQHDGYINVSCEPGKGTTFRIYLPLISTENAVVPLQIQERAVIGGKETILLAEDDEMVRKLIKSVLTGYGYTVIEALDGAEAVSRFREYRDKIDLLLLDLIMPKMNGKEAFDEIRKISPDIKAIFSTGYAPDIIRQKVALADGTIFLNKPVSPTDLLLKVREVLDGK